MVIAFLSFVSCVALNGAESIDDNSSTTSIIQYLLSFVFAGYVGQILFRWQEIRRRLGIILGALNSINQLMSRLIGNR